MTETNIVMERGSDSGDYATFDAAQVAGSRRAKGLAFLASAAESLGDYAEVTFSDDGDDLVLEKVTGSTGRYSTDGPAIRHVYIDYDVLEELGGEMGDESFDAPETLGISLGPATESDFEESAEVPEDAEEDAENLLDGVGDENAVDSEDDSDEQDAEELLEEAEEAA